MDLKERINADFMRAFKAKDMTKKNFLGLIKGEIQNNEGRGIEATDEVVTAIVKKMEKSLTITNTPESLSEIEYLKPYLPTLMGEDKIREILSGFKANGINDFGALMGAFNKEYKGLADNKLVSNIVKTL